MPSPPITIGELTDVPAFDSPIASPWAQEVSRRTVHRFATVAERDAKYPAPAAGLGAICEVAAVLYVSDGTVWVDVTQKTAVTVLNESRQFGAVTYSTNHDWTPAGSPAVEYSVPGVPTWATRGIVHCDLSGVFIAVGAGPTTVNFFLLHAGPTGGPGGVVISTSAFCAFRVTNERYSLSWSCAMSPTWTAGDKIQIGAGVAAGYSIRFDPSCTALFDITWLP